MSMHLKMGPQLSQKLSLSPQLLQSIHLLSMSITELEQAIRKELEENPALEETEEVLENISPEEQREMERLNWTQYTKSTQLTREMSEKNAHQIYERRISEPESLRDHLIWQISVSDFSDSEREILFFIINEIDDNGYLQMTIQNISKTYSVDIQKVNSLLKTLQTFDPLGVGARNLKECLLIQAQHIGEDTQDMVQMIQNHLEDLKTKNYKKIAQSLKLDPEEVKEMADIITSMEPRPGRAFSSQPTQYVIPDIYIYKKDDGAYGVMLNEEEMPQIKITNYYNKILSQVTSSKDKGAQKYLSEKMKRALGFIQALNQRRQTLIKLSEIIAEEQTEFFEKGTRFLHPLLQKEMSQKLGVSISTISRIATNKFVHTPQGVFELKYFFGISYLDREGRRVSLPAMKSIIQKIINEEKESQSDEKISQKIFETEGIQFDRRKVAKIRHELGLESAKKRGNKNRGPL